MRDLALRLLTVTKWLLVVCVIIVSTHYLVQYKVQKAVDNEDFLKRVAARVRECPPVPTPAQRPEPDPTMVPTPDPISTGKPTLAPKPQGDDDWSKEWEKRRGQ